MGAPHVTFDDRYPLLNHPYLHYGVITTTVDMTAVTDDAACVILVNTVPVTITLPLAADNKGYAIYVKKIAAAVGAVTVQRSGADLIDGATSVSISTQYDCVLFVSDGTAWWILAHNP